MGTKYDACGPEERRQAAEDYLRETQYGAANCALLLQQLVEAGFVTRLP